MKKITCSILALIFWIFCMASGRSLVVVGADDSAPLPGATVFTRAGIIAGITDSCGVISGLSAADYPLSVKYLGFEKGSAPSGTDTLRLRESSLGLGEVLVTPADRPVLKLTLYMREYECRTLPGDTLIMFNEHMADCYIPTAKTKFKAVRIPQIRASRCYNRRITADVDTVWCPPVFDDTLSWTDMVEFPSKKLSDNERPHSDIPFGFMHGEPGGPAVASGSIGRNNLCVVSHDFLANSKNHRESPNLLKMFGLTTEFYLMDESWAYRAKPGGEYFPEDIVYGTANVHATIRGKLFKKLIRTDKDTDLLSYIELYVVSAEPMTADEAKADKNNRSAVPDFIVSPLAPPLDPAIQFIVDRAR